MADFAQAVEIVLKNEGGYANTAGDAGGETYAGIARNYNASWEGWATIDRIKRANGGTLKNNTRIAEVSGAVRSFYKRQYWDLRGLGNIANQGAANIVLDTIVQHGRGGTLVQQAVIAAGKPVKVDNSIGQATIAAINSVDAARFVNNLVRIRTDYVRGLSSVPASLKAGIIKRIVGMGMKAAVGGSVAMIALVGGALVLLNRKRK